MEEKENNLEVIKSIVNDIKSDSTITRGKLTGKIREFDKQLSDLNNKDIIIISDYITKLIEQVDNSDNLEKLLDIALENITGTK